MNKKTLGWGAVLIALVLLLAVNVLAGAAFRTSRVDLTEGDLYTLSDGTRAILAGLDEPITLRLFYSRKLAAGYPPIANHAQRTREMLEEYAALSGGTLRFEEADPEPFSEVEDVAVAHGLQGVPVPPAGELLYFGVVGTNSTDEEEILPFLDPGREGVLEYELTELVYELTHRERRTIALYSSLPIEGAPENPFMAGGAQEPWFVVEEIRRAFDVVPLGPEATEIPADADALLLVHPKQLPQHTLYAIDQYVMRGGHALVFVDPLCRADEPPPDPGNQLAALTADRSSGLPTLFAAWGLELEPGLVVGDIEHALQQQAGTRQRPEVIDYPPFIELGDDALAEHDLITQGLSRMTFGMPGSLVPREGATTTFEPLAQTSEAATKLEAGTLLFSDPKSVLADYVPGGQRLTLAARLSGPASSAFPGGDPSGADAEGEDDTADAEDPDETGSGHVASTDAIHVVVVADADMLADSWWVNKQRFLGRTLAMPVTDNGAFAMNALENLTGSNDLISVRSRGRVRRPFDRIAELQREAESRFRQKEQELEARLAETEQRLTELQTQKDPQGASTLILSEEQIAEIERFEEQRLQTRKDLRAVRHELQKDIDGLKARIEFLNVGAVPLVVGLVALGMGLSTSRRRRREQKR